MLVLSSKLQNQTVLSLRTGGQIATTTMPIMNPNNLKIEGFYVNDRFNHKNLVMLSQDIRDQLPQGFVIDDHEVLSEASELVRLQPVLKLKFDLLGKPVFTDKKQRLGKVNDYAVDNQTLYVQKIYVSQRLVKSLSGGQLSIDRNQIVEITDKKIVVLDPLQGTKDSSPAMAPAVP